ncbi:MAG: Stp1/IreP family PP2C-type Ser/Thr phosphatase [Elusimicrobia bacterium]|nr:Stp1/IreP family PP2C-type Ser/Thr phosphatase [Elusimicrobiota bacterium]
MKMLATVLTDTGKVRKSNEDSCLWDDDLGLVIVADGMGGHAAGEVASRLAVEVIREQVSRGLKTGIIPVFGVPAPHWSDRTKLLAAAVNVANDVVFRASQERFERRGMGTTIVAALINGERVSVIHVGDSRFYLIRAGRMIAATRDHSLVAEQVAQGMISASEAERSEDKNILTRALGVGATVDIDAMEPTVRDGDVALLCTDGLTKMVEDEDIFRMVKESKEPVRVCQSLVGLALERGGRDNVTVAAGLIKKERYFDRMISVWREKILKRS